MAFPSGSILDNFNRANQGPPMTGWADILNGFQIISNQAVSVGTTSYSYYTPLAAPADVDVYATIAVKSIADGGNNGVSARIGADAYLFLVTLAAGADTMAIWKQIGGSFSKISADVPQETTAGDKVGLRCVGSTISGWWYNGSVWTKMVEITDSSVPGAGFLGIFGDATLDDFGGGAYVPDVASTLQTSKIRSRRTSW